MNREEVSEESKKDFSNKVNEQAGRKSNVTVTSATSMSKEQLDSWNNDGYILIPNFVDEKFCDDMNEEVLRIINEIVPKDSPFLSLIHI